MRIGEFTMIKLVELKKARGGSLMYQANIEKGLLHEMEKSLNDLKPTKVHSVTRHDTEHEFGLVAVVEVLDVVEEKLKQPLSTEKSKEKKK